MIRELAVGDTRWASAALLALRPQLGTPERLVALIDGVQRPEGYRLVAAFADGDDQAAAAAGFRGTWFTKDRGVVSVVAHVVSVDLRGNREMDHLRPLRMSPPGSPKLTEVNARAQSTVTSPASPLRLRSTCYRCKDWKAAQPAESCHRYR